MRFKEQFCNLALAKKLKALGVEQDSHFYWEEHKTLGTIIVRSCNELDDENCPRLENFSAFTVAELGEMLPMEIKKDYYFETTRMMKEKEGLKRHHWLCGYYKDHKKYFYQLLGESEADARANMLRFLIEKKLIKI